MYNNHFLNSSLCDSLFLLCYWSYLVLVCFPYMVFTLMFQKAQCARDLTDLREGKKQYKLFTLHTQRTYNSFKLLHWHSQCSNYKLQMNFICKKKQAWCSQKCLANNDKEKAHKYCYKKNGRTQGIFTILHA